MPREVSSSHGRVTRAIFELVENAGLDLEDLIRAVVDIEGRAEYREKNDDLLCAGQQTQAAGAAGTFAQVGLVNDTSSGMLGVVEIAWGNTGTYLLRVATQAAIEAIVGWAYAGERVIRDLRRGIKAGLQQFPTLKTGSGVGAGLAGFDFYDRTGADSPTIMRAPSAVAVLPPGTGLVIQEKTAATLLRGNFWWYERIVRKLV
jgi:hypothetical protein